MAPDEPLLLPYSLPSRGHSGKDHSHSRRLIPIFRTATSWVVLPSRMTHSLRRQPWPPPIKASVPSLPIRQRPPLPHASVSSLPIGTRPLTPSFLLLKLESKCVGRNGGHVAWKKCLGTACRYQSHCFSLCPLSHSRNSSLLSGPPP